MISTVQFEANIPKPDEIMQRPFRQDRLFTHTDQVIK